MGEVYRAHDAKLNRDVALKVLPEAFASDPERLARFKREAQVLASLNHPAVAAIYGFEDSFSTHALVLELVEGPTLADVIAKGPIPPDDALAMATRICEGLEYAHERGIVHRDLKPSNIKLAADGTLKILDFGLAKALESDTRSSDIATSPTISRMATQAGVLLGTAAYMAPEQAKSRPADRRSDIWAFGCVLYEMLTGRKTFAGEAVVDTLADVIRAEPDWSRLPGTLPFPVRELLRRCLQKEPRQRLQSIGDARIVLEETLSGAPALIGPQKIRPGNRWLAVAIAGAVAVAAVTGLVVWTLKPSSGFAGAVTRFTIRLPADQALAELAQPALALSTDGSQLAYVATTSGGAPQIYLRSMDSVESRPIPGTQGARNPFFSPDGQWLGFFAGQTLKKVSLKGGVVETVTDVSGFDSGAAWTSDHTIIFAPYSSVLQEVPDTGGAPRPLSRFEKGETQHAWPWPLRSNSVLFSAFSAGPTAIAVQQSGGERRNLVRGPAGEAPKYVPSGHVVYAQAGTLMAVPFDSARVQVTGDAVPVVQGVLQSSTGRGAAQYSVSATGSLVYAPGRLQTAQTRLVFVDRTGTEHVLGTPARVYNQPRLSPDGRRIAVDVVENSGKMQVWLYDLVRDTLIPFTFDSVNRHALWTPDGTRLTFSSNREGSTQIFWQLADGKGGLERLTKNPPTTTADILNIPYSWSPDGKRLMFVKLLPTGGSEVWEVHVDNVSGPEHVPTAERISLEARSPDAGPQFSPDGRWLAYASADESNRRQIYVQPTAGNGSKWQVSVDGGNEPLWNRSGREIFYRNGDKMMAVDVDTQAGFSVGKPRQLFEGRYQTTNAGWVRANYDVSADGQKFLMLKPVEQQQAPVTEITVVLNWQEELKRLVPTKQP